MMFSLKSQSFLTAYEFCVKILSSSLKKKKSLKKKTLSTGLTSHVSAGCGHRQILTCPVLSAYRIKPLKIPIM